MPRAIIRLDDPTSHGGVVQQGFANVKLYGKPMAGVGHRGYCPQCRCEFVILASEQKYEYLGRNAAVEGMLTSCGAVLIATQHLARIAGTPGDS